MEWRRSSFCAGGECAEVAYGRSSFCANGECAEVGDGGDHVHMRSSRRPDAEVVFTREEWEAFLSGVKAGEFG